ncbi:hypothetical protein V6N13_037702 [Hibiscus sabdariffa]
MEPLSWLSNSAVMFQPLAMNLKYFVWNDQGCGSRNFIRVTREYIRDHHPDICVFVETRLSCSRAAKVIASLGFSNSFRVEALGFTGGIWICWFDTIELEILSCHFQFVHCRISDGNDSILSTFVYASPHSRQRNDLWFCLQELAGSIFEPWCLIGDFNATLYYSERKGCSSSSLDIAFQNMIFHCGLEDLGYSGSDFTWYRGNCEARLDRCLGNSQWFEKFPTASLSHLLRMKSDHRPLLLLPYGLPQLTRGPQFRYLSCWSMHQNFKKVVVDNWNSSLPIVESIQHFTAAASLWNKDVFGLIGKNKKILMARLRGVQRYLDHKRSRGLIKLEQKLMENLELLLDQEEELWKQKARMDWIKFGDRNTRFFHAKATARHRRKAISPLQITLNEWCDDTDRLKDATTTYFANLFSTDVTNHQQYPLRGYFPVILVL